MTVALTGCLCKKKKKTTTKLTYSEVALKKNKKSRRHRDSQDVEQYAVDGEAADLRLASADGTFQKVYFDFDRTSIRPDQRAAVDYDAKLARQATTAADSAVVVIGKADAKYLNPAYNVAVSQKRAEVMKQEFALAGVARDKVKALGVGDTQLEVPVAGAEPLNRCAVMQVVRG